MRDLMAITVDVYYPDMQLDSVKNGEIAFQRISDTDYDCVITDCSMPKISGLDLIRKIEDAGIDIPVIVFTGDAQVSEQIKSELVEEVFLKHNTMCDDIIDTVVQNVLTGPGRPPEYQEG